MKRNKAIPLLLHFTKKNTSRFGFAKQVLSTDTG